MAKGDREMAKTEKTESRKLDAETMADRPYFRFELVGPGVEVGAKLNGKGDVIISSGKMFRNRANVRESGLRWAELFPISAGKLVVTRFPKENSKTREVEEILK
jgi:hypothetical protein